MKEQKSLTIIEKVIFLKSMDIFAHATIEQLGAIAALTGEVDFVAGQSIYRQGEPTDAVYLILKGSVTIKLDGRILREMGERQAIGTVAALDLCPAPHDVTAVRPVHALELKCADFHDLLALDYELVKAVLRSLCLMIRENQ
ncbi:MAG TPA: cyclic nucleotide-binding domain-containing protein [Candidatus Binatia bacterium]|nr:cyclic nucleotide-binding domain-containing protein [Candidatus Binatia bacterium]